VVPDRVTVALDWRILPAWRTGACWRRFTERSPNRSGPTVRRETSGGRSGWPSSVSGHGRGTKRPGWSSCPGSTWCMSIRSRWRPRLRRDDGANAHRPASDRGRAPRTGGGAAAPPESRRSASHRGRSGTPAPTSNASSWTTRRGRYSGSRGSFWRCRPVWATDRDGSRERGRRVPVRNRRRQLRRGDLRGHGASGGARARPHRPGEQPGQERDPHGPRPRR